MFHSIAYHVFFPILTILLPCHFDFVCNYFKLFPRCCQIIIWSFFCKYISWNFCNFFLKFVANFINSTINVAELKCAPLLTTIYIQFYFSMLLSAVFYGAHCAPLHCYIQIDNHAIFLYLHSKKLEVFCKSALYL